MELAVVLTILASLLAAGVVPFLVRQREHARDAVIQAEVRRAAVVLMTSSDDGEPPDSLGELIAAGFEPADVVDPANAEVSADPPCVALGHERSGRTWRWTTDGVEQGRCTELAWRRGARPATGSGE